jgi:integral membrane protein
VTHAAPQPGGVDARRLEFAQLRRLEIASMLEATTLVVLVCVAVPLKHLGHFDTAVRIIGPVHGLAFLAYLWTVLQTVTGGGWPGRAIARLVLTAFIPFAGFTTPTFLRPRLQAVAAG